MEELNNKLSSGNPVVTAHVVSKLIQNIKNKLKKDHSEIAEFTFLTEKCVGNNQALSTVASEAILHIVRNSGNYIKAKSVIVDLITIITTTKCPCSSVTYLINNLLLIDIETELSINNYYKSTFNLQLPQHPFIVLLDEDTNCWSSVFREMKHSYTNVENSNIGHYNELYKPVFLYVLCNPHENNLTTLKQKLWTFIIHNESISKSGNILNCVLSWMQFERRNHVNPECKNVIEVNADLLIELSDLNVTMNIFNQNLLLLWQTSALHQLIFNNFDPRAMILSINNIIIHCEDETILHPVLLILAKSVPLCSSVYLAHLLKLYKTIISQTKCDPITVQIIKHSLLQWVASPTLLTSEALIIANQILSLLKGPPRKVPSMKGFVKFSMEFKSLINTNNDVYISLQLCVLLETWKSYEEIVNWLEELKKTPTYFISKIVHFLFGLLLCDFKETKINIMAFELILKCVDYNKMLASNVLTAILHKLTNITESELHYQVLKAIPKMAILKDNIHKIVNTIQALSKGRNSLKTFSTTLMLDLWKIDNKCYPYLETFLIAPFSSQSDKWEFYITRSHVLKELCALKPELYGKDMVAHLSKILNECKNADGAVACALAIDGITFLCKFEIIDAVTTWATLAPMFKDETRIPVIKSLCSLISEIPNLSYTEAYPQLTEEVISKLWEFTVYNRDNEVWKAALEALTHFEIEQIVTQMPEEYSDDDVVNKSEQQSDEYCDVETVNVKKSSNVIPGQCWIQFLKNCESSKLEIVGDFLIKMMSLEISNYLKFVYQVKGTREPVDYSYLPLNSVVRGISIYIKSSLLKWKGGIYKEVYLQCLRIFSQEYSKPLPPLDWCFLQELVHEPEAKNFCINIASHQVILSGTARRFIVNYIEAITENYTNETDVSVIYQNLKYLANSVQPFTLKPFLEITICNALELFKNHKEEHLLFILKHLKVTLKDQAIQESNKIVIAEIVINIFNETDISSKLFDVVLECVACFPIKYVNDLSSPKLVSEVRTEWLKKAIKIRCHLALNSNETPLNWLNELMEVGSSFPGVTIFMFEEFTKVFQKHKDNTECVLWILDLIGQIQALTAEKAERKKILFLCNVFILATLVFSGHYIFLKDLSDSKLTYELFPRAITTLLEVNYWSICTNQVLEWFYHMNTNTERIFYNEYQDMFVQCLQSLRNDDEFHKYMKWTKYLNVEFS